MVIRKIVNHAEMLPAWYGVAWVDHMRDQAICYPVPLNLAAAALRAVWMFMKHGARAVSRDPRGAYDQGFKAGRASVPTAAEWRPYLTLGEMAEVNAYRAKWPGVVTDDQSDAEVLALSRINPT